MTATQRLIAYIGAGMFGLICVVVIVGLIRDTIDPGRTVVVLLPVLTGIVLGVNGIRRNGKDS